MKAPPIITARAVQAKTTEKGARESQLGARGSQRRAFLYVRDPLRGTIGFLEPFKGYYRISIRDPFKGYYRISIRSP